jgi:hypothetical protein
MKHDDRNETIPPVNYEDNGLRNMADDLDSLLDEALETVGSGGGQSILSSSTITSETGVQSADALDVDGDIDLYDLGLSLRMSFCARNAMFFLKGMPYWTTLRPLFSQAFLLLPPLYRSKQLPLSQRSRWWLRNLQS